MAMGYRTRSTVEVVTMAAVTAVITEAEATTAAVMVAITEVAAATTAMAVAATDTPHVATTAAAAMDIMADALAVPVLMRYRRPPICLNTTSEQMK